MKASEVARALKAKRAGRYWACCCPVHDDRSPSLSFWDGHSNVVFHCWAGCEAEDIIDELKRRGVWKRRA